MSDNPADSLRRELAMASGEDRWPFIEAMHAACPRTVWSYRECGPCASRVNAIWPLVEAALEARDEAARADERERLQGENQQLRERLEAIRRDPTLALVTNVKPFKVVFEDGD